MVNTPTRNLDGRTLLIGIVGEHEDPETGEILDNVLAWLMQHPQMHLLAKGIAPDCLVAPPERDGVHVELYWVRV